MKRSSPTRVQKSTIGKGASPAPMVSRNHRGMRTAATLKRTQRVRRSNRDFAYPAGSIGRDVAQRDYVQYLLENYHRNRQLEPRFGDGRSLINYVAIFKGIEREFQAPIYFISQERFGDLVEYLQRRLDRTLLGKSNRARGIRNYASPEEFAAAPAPR